MSSVKQERVMGQITYFDFLISISTIFSRAVPQYRYEAERQPTFIRRNDSDDNLLLIPVQHVLSLLLYSLLPMLLLPFMKKLKYFSRVKLFCKIGIFSK